MGYPTIVDEAVGIRPNSKTYATPLPELSTGDFILVIVSFNLSESQYPNFSGTPTFTEVFSAGGGPNLGFLVGYRIVDGTEGYAGDGSDTTNVYTYDNSVGTYRSINYGKAEYVASANNGDPYGENYNPPNLDVGTAEPLMWLAVAADLGGTAVDTWPSTFTQERKEYASNSMHALCRLDANASSQNPSTYVITNESQATAITLAIRSTAAKGGGFGGFG